MKYLKSIVAKGKGSIAVILPDTVSSARWQTLTLPLSRVRSRRLDLSPASTSFRTLSVATRLSTPTPRRHCQGCQGSGADST